MRFLLPLSATLLLLAACASPSSQGGTGDQQTAAPGLRLGTGVAVHPEGLVLTAWHVVAGSRDIKVKFADGTQSPAQVVAQDEAHDLVVLKLREAPPAFLGLAPGGGWMGERVFTVGYPAVEILGLHQTLSDGVVSSLGGIREVPDSLTTSVPIQPGNSGGPLVDYQGRVVGVIAASADALNFYRQTGVLPQSLSWAVKADAAARLFTAPPAPPPAATRREAIERTAAATCWILAF